MHLELPIAEMKLGIRAETRTGDTPASDPSRTALQELVFTLGNGFAYVEGSIARGLDYYTDTVFELVHGDLGAQNALAAIAAESARP